MPVGDLLHDLHRDLVLVAGGVGIAVDRRHFVLGGCCFVVLGLGEDAEFPQLVVQVLHKCGNSGADRAKIVILQLLSSGRFSAKERSSRHDQIFALLVEILIEQEIFLFRADLGDDPVYGGVTEEVQDADSLLAHRVH